jgi:hypothetical protein
MATVLADRGGCGETRRIACRSLLPPVLGRGLKSLSGAGPRWLASQLTCRVWHPELGQELPLGCRTSL